MALGARARFMAAAALVIATLSGVAQVADNAAQPPRSHCARAPSAPAQPAPERSGIASDIALRRAMWLPVGAY